MMSCVRIRCGIIAYVYVHMISFRVIILPTECSSIVNKYPEWVKGRDLATCRNRCGFKTRLCSCKINCRILGNCCENYQQACTNDYNNIQRIKHLFNANVGCYAKLLMVDKIPQQMAYYPNGTTQVAANPQIQSQSDAVRNQFIQETRSRRPVIDLYNEVIFKNKLIFEYYAVNESQPLYWVSEVDINNYVSLGEIDKLFQKFIGPHIKYYPPLNVDTFELPTCMQSAIGCPASITNNTDLVEKCDRFITYVLTQNEGDDRFDTTYKNVYCKMCHNDTNDNYYFVSTKFVRTRHHSRTGLSVLMSETNDGYTFENKGENSDPLNWRQIVCDNSYSMEYNKNKLTCSVVTCPEGLHLNSKGQCRYRLRLRITIGVKDVDIVSGIGLFKLSPLFWCLLQSRSSSVFIDDDYTRASEPSMLYNSFQNKYFYTFDINVLWPRMHYDYHVSTFNAAIDIVAKTIARYASRDHKDSINTKDTIHHEYSDDINDRYNDCDSDSKNKVNKIFSKTDFNCLNSTNNDYASKGIHFDLDHDQTNIQTSIAASSLNDRWFLNVYVANMNHTTSSCICLRKRNESDICDNICWKTPSFKRDNTEINQMMKSKCFLSCCPCATVSYIRIVQVLFFIEVYNLM